MKATTLTAIEAELKRARELFPNTKHNTVALMEEVGELAQALLDLEMGKQTVADVYAEAIQVAVMAIDIAERGDSNFEKYHYSLDSFYAMMDKVRT